MADDLKVVDAERRWWWWRWQWQSFILYFFLFILFLYTTYYVGNRFTTKLKYTVRNEIIKIYY